MTESFREAIGLLLGDTSGKFIAGSGLVAVVVGAAVDPIAGAIVAASLIVALVIILSYALRQRTLSRGPYDVLDETITWEFPDSSGKTVYVQKRQKVRFNYLSIVLLELASGDGNLFAEFECDYGHKLKDVSRGDEKGILVELTTERRRGEECELRSKRTITDGWTGPDEWVTFRASVPSDKTELVFVFPSDVRDIRITGPRGHGSRPAKEGKEIQTLPSTRVLTVKGRRYKVNSVVKVTWSWRTPETPPQSLQG